MSPAANPMPDSYITRDIPVWERDPNSLVILRLRIQYLKVKDEFNDLTICAHCGQPLQYKLNPFTGRIELQNCFLCHTSNPEDIMNAEQKEKLYKLLFGNN